MITVVTVYFGVLSTKIRYLGALVPLFTVIGGLITLNVWILVGTSIFRAVQRTTGRPEVC